MKKLKRNLTILSKKSVLLLSTIVLLCSTVQADQCSVDCQDALKKADKLIGSLKEEISVYKQITNKQQDMITDLRVETKEKGDQLQSPLRNPFIMLGVGVLACGLGQAFNPNGAVCGLFQK